MNNGNDDDEYPHKSTLANQSQRATAVVDEPKSEKKRFSFFGKKTIY